MKSLEGNLYEADNRNPKQQLQIELEQNKIEEIILQSIDDQETLFSQTFFPSAYKDDSNDLYAKDILDMCSSHDMDDVSYMIPRSKIEKLQKKSPTRNSVTLPSQKGNFGFQKGTLFSL